MTQAGIRDQFCQCPEDSNPNTQRDHYHPVMFAAVDPIAVASTIVAFGQLVVAVIVGFAVQRTKTHRNNHADT